MADGGTLYLDEVADMPLSTQARILRVLTEQAFVRVGGHRQIRVDVRVVSSTARDLEKEIAERRFREDLFYRLNVVPVAIPSLAERREDIPSLVDHFFARFAADQGVRAARSGDGSDGGAAELRMARQRAPAAQCGGTHDHPDPARGSWAGSMPTCCRPKMLSGRISGDSAMPSLMGVPLREARENFEREYLRVQIRRFSGNISRTAAFIGMERSALHRKLKLLGMVGGARRGGGRRRGLTI
jgi:two-component system nitrogen regulation response regulator NtrX